MAQRRGTREEREEQRFASDLRHFLIDIGYQEGEAYCRALLETGDFALASGQQVPWATLKGWLQDMNEAMQGSLVLCMSSCHGLNAHKMAGKLGTGDDRAPFHTLVGSKDTVDWADALVAFTSFYQLVIRKGVAPKEAASKMNAAAGLQDDLFAGVEHKNLKANLRELRAKETEKLAERIEQFAWLAGHKSKR